MIVWRITGKIIGVDLSPWLAGGHSKGSEGQSHPEAEAEAEASTLK